jgi:general secretion pathway protein A
MLGRRVQKNGQSGMPPRIMDSTLDIYNAHFGLVERPFSLLPDPDFLFWSAQHQRAFAMLEYGLLTRAPITLITGEVGAGKTTILQHLLRSVGEDVRIGLISNAHGDRGELLRWVLMALGEAAPPTAGYVDLFAVLQALLISEYAAGRRVILIFDEAQNLSRESLEELRMFTNINSGKDELLQLVLVGQPELRSLVLQPDLTQFAQRVASSFHLTAMDEKTVCSYIRHRLAVAESSWDIFSPLAVREVFQASRGVPRLVNQLCDLAMVYAYSKQHKFVLRKTVRQVLDDGVFFAGGMGTKAPLLLSDVNKVE